MKHADLYRTVPIRDRVLFNVVKHKLLDGEFKFSSKAWMLTSRRKIQKGDLKIEAEMSIMPNGKSGYLYWIDLSWNPGGDNGHRFFSEIRPITDSPEWVKTSSYPDFHGRPDEYFLRKILRILAGIE